MRICHIWNCGKEVEYDWKGKYKDVLYCKQHNKPGVEHK